LPNSPTLAVRELTRDFTGRRILGPLTVDAHRGERIALVGPNGSGKSSFLRCVAGVLAPSSGTVSVNGFAAGTRAAKAQIGASLSQERSFYLRLTGEANLSIFAELRQPADRAKAEVRSIVSELGISDIAAQRVDRCSTGMVQQLALARALLGRAPLLLLDEPTRSLDAAAIERLWGALAHRSDATLLIATHRPEDIERCDRSIAFAA
jgi:ABC-type multidrug transport system ATPase subunit